MKIKVGQRYTVNSFTHDPKIVEITHIEWHRTDNTKVVTYRYLIAGSIAKRTSRDIHEKLEQGVWELHKYSDSPLWGVINR